MKKLIAVLLCAVFSFFTVIPAFANDVPADDAEYFEDGSYTIVKIGDPVNNEKENIFIKFFDLIRKILSFFTGKSSTEKTKYVCYYDRNGVLLWEVRLKARFTYSAREAVCDSAEISYEMYDPDWKMISSSASKSGDTATGYFSVRQTKLGVPLKTVEKTLVIVCDTKGNVI